MQGAGEWGRDRLIKTRDGRTEIGLLGAALEERCQVNSRE